MQLLHIGKKYHCFLLLCPLKGLIQLTIITPKGQPREDGATKGAQTRVMEESGVIEGCWCTAGEKTDRVNSLKNQTLQD